MAKASKKSNRVKNPNPAPQHEPVKERIKAGAPGSPVVLPDHSEPPQEDKKSDK